MIAAAAGCIASAAVAEPIEIDYPKGSLGFGAISAADYARAEAQLRGELRVSRQDPAWLINYGHVLLKTGRYAEAALTFEQASKAQDVELILADGRVMSSREAARRALQATSVGGPSAEEQ
jgi:Flp pilus assembly protein TadD